MGYIGRRIGLSQDNGDSNPGAAGGAVGGGLLDLFAHGYFERQGDIYNAPGLPPSGLTATGGVISDYTSGSDVYRAHIFTSSGTFNVTAPGNLGDTVEYLVVAGGGGGGGGVYGGGGGAGGLRTNLSGHPMSTNNPSITVSTSPGSYTVTIGGGGNGGAGAANDGINGTNSVFSTITSNGGGGGRGRNQNGPGIPGGSGGGQSYGNPADPFAVQGYGYNPSTPGAVLGAASLPSPYAITQGQDGGFAPSSAHYGTGGGGAGQQGSGQNDGPWPAYGYPGGDGVQVYIAGPPTNTGIGQTSSWFAGGGGGGGPHADAVLSLGGAGGGGVGGSPTTNVGAGSGLYSTGSGGGGGQPQSPAGTGSDHGGSGGSGIVIVRYKIAELTATAKATGGAISFYGGKTIHAFTSTGTFVCPGPFSETCEYVVIGGGGSGGSGSANTNSSGGGGGAGTYRTGSVSVSSGTYNITIGAGGGKNNGSNNGSQGGTTTLALPSSVASPGGGYGYPGPTPGYDGGSSGGTVTQATTATGDPFPGTIGATPTSGWGHIGNNATSVPAYNTGGGGGAGGAAPPQPGANLSPGGIGIQIPSTFRDPASTVGAPGPTSPGVSGADTSGKFYVAGGGGGAAGYPQPAQPKGGDGGFGGGGDGGGIDPNGNSFTGNGFDATQNTGSGGGGGPTGDNTFSGSGGSGIVLIAYPS